MVAARLRRTAEGVAALVLAGACSLPTERGGEVRVVLDPVPLLTRGDTQQLRARLSLDGRVMASGDFAFAADRPDIVAVSPEGRAAGTGFGYTTVRARSLSFAQALPDSAFIKVRDPAFDVDTIWPDTARVGDTLTLAGPGLVADSVLAAQLAGRTAFVAPGPPGTVRVVAPVMPVAYAAQPESTAGTLTITGYRGQRGSLRRIAVHPFDRLEPNEFAPADIGVLTGPRHLPSLALEAGSYEVSNAPAYDWYRFTNPVQQDVSVVVESPDISRYSYLAVLTQGLQAGGGLSVGRGYLPLSPLPGAPLRFTHGVEVCNWAPMPGFGGADIDQTGDGRAVVRALPPGIYDVVVSSDFVRSTFGSYSLRVTPGLVVEVAADAAEDDDVCELAATLTLPSTRTLSLDHRDDHDWARFTLAAADSVHVRVTADPPTTVMRLLLISTPVIAWTPPVLDTVISPGATAEVSTFLAAGTYLLMTWGLAPTAYTVGVRTGTTP